MALNRECERVLADIALIAADTKATPHERQFGIYNLVEQRDRTLGEAFNDLHRSTAIIGLPAICPHNLVS